VLDEALVRKLKSIVGVPIYRLIGVARGRLVYGSTAEGVYHLYALDLEKKTAARISREPVHLYAGVRHESPYVVFPVDVSKGFEMCKIFAVNLDTAEVVDLFDGLQPQRIIGAGFDGYRVAWTGVTKDSAGIYVADVSGGKPELVARTRGREYVTDVSRDFIVGFGHLRGDHYSTELFIVDLRTGEMKVVTPREGSANVAPRIRGREVYFVSDFRTPDRMRIYRYSVDSGEFAEVRFSYGDLDAYDPVEIVDYGWSDGGEMWVVGKREGRTRLFIDGRVVEAPKGFISAADIYRGRAYIQFSSLREPPKIISVDLSTGRIETVVDNRLPEEVAEELGEVVYAKFRSFDGLEIPTYVLKNAKAGEPGPTVVYPHGGPWAEVADSWSPMIAALAAMGYHVVAPNFRGSTGYGEKFRRMDIGDPGGGDLMDVVYAKEWAVKSGIADEGRVCVVGYSYGGYLAFMAAAKHSDLWKCVVAGAGVTDWREDYELADEFFKRYDEILFAGRFELFEERSPITYAKNIRTSLCIIHPQNDSRCPLKPIMKFAYRLMELGKPFELHVIPDIGHAITLDPKSLYAFLIYTAMFLRKHLGQPLHITRK